MPDNSMPTLSGTAAAFRSEYTRSDWRKCNIFVTQKDVRWITNPVSVTRLKGLSGISSIVRNFHAGFLDPVFAFQNGVRFS
jgi:hypothetical protein